MLCTRSVLTFTNPFLNTPRPDLRYFACLQSPHFFIFKIFVYIPEAYSEPYQESRIELLEKVNGFYTLIVFTNSSILNFFRFANTPLHPSVTVFWNMAQEGLCLDSLWSSDFKGSIVDVRLRSKCYSVFKNRILKEDYETH